MKSLKQNQIRKSLKKNFNSFEKSKIKLSKKIPQIKIQKTNGIIFKNKFLIKKIKIHYCKH